MRAGRVAAPSAALRAVACEVGWAPPCAAPRAAGALRYCHARCAGTGRPRRRAGLKPDRFLPLDDGAPMMCGTCAEHVLNMC